MSRLLVIVNDIDSTPGRFLPWMIAAGVEFDLRIGGRAELPRPEELDDYDGLIMCGGGFMPDEIDRAPWLADEAELVRHALDADLPQLGVCLGGQLIAQVIGGDVRAQTGAPEKGYTWIDLTPQAAADPVFSAIAESVPGATGSPGPAGTGEHSERIAFVESHVDRIVDLPAEATLLASSEACHFQAFRVGRAWGTQFHPEATKENISRWDPIRLQTLGFDKSVLVQEADERGEDSERAAKAMFDAFLSVVGTN